MSQQVISARPQNSRQGINIFAQHRGDFPVQQIPHHAAANARQHANGDGQQRIIRKAALQRHINTGNAENAQADCVKKIQHAGIIQPQQAGRQLVPGHSQQAIRQKNGAAGQRRQQEKDVVAEHCRRGYAKQQIPDDAAAKGRDNAQHQNAENIQILLRGQHGPGNGKGNGADGLRHKNNACQQKSPSLNCTASILQENQANV